MILQEISGGFFGRLPSLEIAFTRKGNGLSLLKVTGSVLDF